MKHSKLIQEVIAVILVLLATIGTAKAIFKYEDNLTKKRNVIEVKPTNNFGWNPEVIRVKKGELVKIRVNNTTAVSHGFGIAGLGVEAKPIYPGHQELFEFTPTKTGEFSFNCTVVCDKNNHLGMTGKIIVE
ncbi:MAG: cupredoxin domain-containing protein [Nitrospinae bacterium]|nr:cupredoxin domain-containing protein [Nitrospinota bacterium]